MSGIPYTKEQLAFMEKHGADMTTTELTNALNKDETHGRKRSHYFEKYGHSQIERNPRPQLCHEWRADRISENNWRLSLHKGQKIIRRIL